MTDRNPFVGRYWETVQRLKINQFYGAPTAVRLLLKYGDAWVKKYDRSSLRTLGSGEHSVVWFSMGLGLRGPGSAGWGVLTGDRQEEHPVVSAVVTLTRWARLVCKSWELS